jgi:diguanylate cyclase (GGDEF)-like protein
VKWSLDRSAARAPWSAPRLRRAAVGCAVGGASIGALALIGWAANAPALERLLPGHPQMSVSAALLFLLAGLALVGDCRCAPGSEGRRAARAGAKALAAVGVIALAGWVSGGSLGIASSLVGGDNGAALPDPSRLAVNEALGFVLLGAAMLASDVRLGRWWPANVLAWASGALALLALQGYATGAEPLTGLGARQHIPVGAAAAFGLLSLGVLLARPERGATAKLLSGGPASLVLRRLLPVAIALPAGVVTLTLVGQQLDLYGMADGEWMFAAAITFAFGALAWVIAAAAERTELEQTRWLRFHAERDPLTGLFNRRRLGQELAAHVTASERYGTAGALIVCDLDNLKLVNDTLGHQAGDELIKGVVRTIEHRLRQTDVLARLGGDEFAVLLPHTDMEGARAAAESIRAAVHDFKTVVGQRTLHTTLSVGIALGGE